MNKKTTLSSYLVYAFCAFCILWAFSMAQEKKVAEVTRTRNYNDPLDVLNGRAGKGYEKLPIKVFNQSDVVGVRSGYYVIANVYKNKKYLNAFMAELKSKGLDAKQFYNKENGLHYVYLADYNYKEDAKIAFTSNLDGKYQDEKWIMGINGLSL